MQLQYEIRKVPAFQLNTRVLAASGGTVDIQLGTDMGIKKGDEYAVIVSDTLDGIVDEKEVGLLMIKETGNARSKAITLFSSIPVVKDVQLREIPRLGLNFEPYLNWMQYLTPSTNDGALLLGAKVEMVRGFYNVKPYAAVQALLDSEKAFQFAAVVGGQYSIYLARLELSGRAGVAGGANIITRIIEEIVNEGSDDPWFTHYGVSAGATVSFLVNRDMKIFVDGQLDYMLGLLDGLGSEWFDSYGGISAGIGVSFKQ